jgi:hypothetical protein
LPQILGPTQVLASSVKNHDYNNLAFEVHAKKKLRNNIPKNNIINFIKSFIC